MALNNFKCNHLMPLHFKGLILLLFCTTGSYTQNLYIESGSSCVIITLASITCVPAKQGVVLSSFVCQYVCRITEKLLIRNWRNSVTMCVMVLPEVIGFWWHLTFTFGLDRKLPITWKLLVRRWCISWARSVGGRGHFPLLFEVVGTPCVLSPHNFWG